MSPNAPPTGSRQAGAAIRVFADVDELSHAAAAEVVRIASASIAARGRFRVALAGGSTPRRLYALLAAPPYRERVAWNAVEFFWGDERAVPPDHAESNYRMAHDALLSKVDVTPAQVHRMRAESADRDAAARDYQMKIARAFDVSPDGPPPAFDLIVLGMGADGHTASLFPYTAAVRESQRWVVAQHVATLAADRLTLTRVILNQAVAVMFLVVGGDKAAVVAEVLDGPSDALRLPAQLIRPAAGRLLWFLDRAAASAHSRVITS